MLKTCVLSISFFVFVISSQTAFCELEATPHSVFDLPQLQAISLRDATVAFSKKDYAAAEELLRAAIDRVPSDFRARYNLACALARLGKTDE